MTILAIIAVVLVLAVVAYYAGKWGEALDKWKDG